VLTKLKIYDIILIERGKELTSMATRITINFDMDGTIADLYGVENWLAYLLAEDTTPYEVAKPLVRLATLARRLNALQKAGYENAVITWLGKNATEDYNKAVTMAKLEWLAKHMPTVHWDRVTVVPYGTPKENWCNNPLDILFDDERQNRENWTGRAYDVDNILGVLKMLG
jgi:5'(3')-deoxyribonucleotidase